MDIIFSYYSKEDIQVLLFCSWKKEETGTLRTFSKIANEFYAFVFSFYNSKCPIFSPSYSFKPFMMEQKHLC